MTIATSDPVLLNFNDGIAEIRFNRPESLNAVNVETAVAFRDAVAAATAAPSTRVIALTSAGRAFIAGGDLAYLRDAGERAPQAARVLINAIHDAIEGLARAPQPVVAVLHGAVAGAGMSVALAADLAIAADDTVFNMAYIKVANSPDCSASWTLPRLVGLRKATEILMLSENLDATEALRLGLVNRVVPLASLEEEAAKLLNRLKNSAPLALRSIKRLLQESDTNSLRSQLDAEREAFAGNCGSRDFREAVDAFFNKRKPQFEGR